MKYPTILFSTFFVAALAMSQTARPSPAGARQGV
jgi:hypothetical protein